MIKINDFTPWDKIIRVGNAYHGWWRKADGGGIEAVSRLTGSVIPYDSSVMSISEGTGPCWLTRFPGISMPDTTQAEADSGLYWTNYVIWSGVEKYYDSIRNVPSLGNQIQLQADLLQWVYRCSDGAVYWMLYDKTYKVLRALTGGAPNQRWGSSISSYPVVFDMSGLDVPTWVNFSESGSKAAFGMLNAGASQPNWILEIDVNGGSKTEPPTASQHRYRVLGSQSAPLITKDYPSQPDFVLIDSSTPLIDSLGSQIMDVNWSSGVSSMPTSDDPNAKWLVNGLAHRVDKNIVFVDYDGETAVDIGYSGEYKCQIEQYFIPGPIQNGSATVMLTTATFSTQIGSVFRGEQHFNYYVLTRDAPHPLIVEIPSGSEAYAAAVDANNAQVVFTSVVNIGPPYPYEVTGPDKNQQPVIVNLYSKYLVLTSSPVPYYTWLGKRYYTYSSTTTFYGWVCGKSGGILPDGVQEQFNYFSVDPLIGTYTPGIVGYF